MVSEVVKIRLEVAGVFFVCLFFGVFFFLSRVLSHNSTRLSLAVLLSLV